MKLLGSIVYLTSAFYSLEGMISLVHWTHSFCIFIITQRDPFCKIACSIKKNTESWGK